MRHQPAYISCGTRPVHQLKAQGGRAPESPSPQSQTTEGRSVRLLRFLMIVSGFVLLLIGFAHLGTARTAEGWSQVSATITKAQVVRMAYSDGIPVFTADIEYTYVADGQRFTGTQLGLQSIRSQSPGAVKRMIAPYKVGRMVLAHVNPTRPTETYLSVNSVRYLRDFILPGLLLIGLSLILGKALSLSAERQRRRALRFGLTGRKARMAAV